MSGDGEPTTLGGKLRKARNDRGLSLRDVERESGVNSGYLSQLERDEIANPSPAMLQKLAEAYGEPFAVLMEWAGYVEPGLSPNAQRALSVLGDDFTDKELEVVKVVLDMLRDRGTGFSEPHRTDRLLSPDDHKLIQAHALALLREIDALGDSAHVDLEAAYTAAKLVRAGEIELTLDEKRRLRQWFGDLVDRPLRAILGFIQFSNNEVYVQPDLHRLKERFVLGHEAGHAVLPDHRAVFAYLDDKTRLKPDFNDLLERQANQFSIELLTKGGRLREEFDDSAPSAERLADLADRYQVSLQAAARFVAEESQHAIAVSICHRGFKGRGGLQAPRVYTSLAFEARIPWRSGGLAPVEDLRAATRLVAAGATVAPMSLVDVGGRTLELIVEGIDARYSVIVLYAIRPQKPTRLRPFAALSRR